MGTVHADERVQRVGEPSALGIIFRGTGHGQLLDLRGEAASRLVLLKKGVDQVNQLARFSKTGKQVILLQLLVVLLHEVADDSGRVRQNCGIEILLRL